MFVRAHDIHTKEYYKSMVYTLLDTGYFQQAVLYHPVLDSFVLVRHLDESEQPAPLYECIQPDRTGWVSVPAEGLTELKAAPTREYGARQVAELQGYPEVVSDRAFLKTLLSTGFVPREQVAIPLRHPADLHAWNYVKTQADADTLMEHFCGFHDATLERLFYKENTGTRQLTARFDNANQYGTIDLCFEGTIALHLQPAGESLSRELLEACLLVREETVFWADAALKQEQLDREHNYIKALNLKWRRVRGPRHRYLKRSV